MCGGIVAKMMEGGIAQEEEGGEKEEEENNKRLFFFSGGNLILLQKGIRVCVPSKWFSPRNLIILDFIRIESLCCLLTSALCFSSLTAKSPKFLC